MLHDMKEDGKEIRREAFSSDPLMGGPFLGVPRRRTATPKTTLGRSPGLRRIFGLKGSSAVVIVLLALGVPLAPANAGCDFCIDYSKPYDSQVAALTGSSNSPPSNNPANNPSSEKPDSEGIRAFLIPMSEVSEDDLILDISPEADEYLEGALSVNYEEFVTRDGRIRTTSEIAEILGNAGISRDDAVVIYGECLPCGGGPVPATFTYWLLKYLGHENVRILDGNIDDWKAAGLATSGAPATRPAVDYVPQENPDLLATYDYVKSGKAQIVDGRAAEAADPASIPGSVNIPAETILEGEKIKGAEDLEAIFKDLRKDRPVVVYTNTGVNGAVFWFVLEMMGYDAVLYSWRDWLENQPPLELRLVEVLADPNPVKAGGSVGITAAFSEVRARVVRIGSSASPSSEDLQPVLKFTAIFTSRDGTEAGRTSLQQTAEGRYTGVWVADVDPGIYSLDIIGSRSGSAGYVRSVLDLEVTDG
ncbi:sulfurtransferase [Methanothrix harundinacea]|nr:rhodanese-like domain-containing protein [Methanothrix harundinacea]